MKKFDFICGMIYLVCGLILLIGGCIVDHAEARNFGALIFVNSMLWLRIRALEDKQ